jgi:hypothetical protein
MREMSIAGALRFSVAPGIASAILALPVKGVR